jgi:cysteine desulfurase
MSQEVYLDYCATTPMHPDVREAMLATLEDSFGNPSSMHRKGQESKRLLENARQQVAQGLSAQAEEIVFTSGATESDNLAVLGTLRASSPDRKHLITCAVEHHAILHPAESLAQGGYDVSVLPVDQYGRVDPDDVRRSIRKDTALISIMLVNNEVGTIQPIKEIGAIAREHGVWLHTDAVQGVGLLEIDVDELAVDLLSLSAHKIYGPKGIGALYIRRGTHLHPIIHGGTQEASLRPGTENLHGIVGLGAAVSLTLAHKKDEMKRLGRLRKRFLEGLRQRLPGTIVNGPSEECSPHIISTSFPGTNGEMMLFHLNTRGIAASMGSACTTESIEPSHVLTAMGLPREQIEGTLRFSLGYPTEDDEISYVLDKLPDAYAKSQDN